MKKTLFILLSLFFVAVIPCSAAQKGYMSAQKTLEVLQKIGVMRGSEMRYVRSADTDNRGWKVHLFEVKQANMELPLITYVDNKGDIVVGILIKNGKLVMPKIPVADMQPAVEMKGVVSTEGREVYNPKGSDVILMFSDPECPYCQAVEKKLSEYHGRYKIIIKNFPLSIHQGAKQESIERQCKWLSGGGQCNRELWKKAEEMVKEDIAEGAKLGVNGTPFYVDMKGHILQAIPDLK